MINYVQGDLFTTNCDIIAHGCNCVGGFGAGVARTMANKYPESRDKFMEKHRTVKWNLGDVQFVKTNGKIIANCATQFYYGGKQKGHVYADYGAIEECMKKLLQYSLDNNLSVAIPKIGAGLAGGNWSMIEKIIESVFINKEITIYYL